MMAPNANVRQVVQGTEQVLPTWLTYSPIVGPSGTSYTILRLPLTYYGPSIPLGTDGTWTYGGLSSPPPSATASMTPTSTPPPVTTVPPTSTFSSTTLPTSTSLTSTRPTTTTFASVSVITRSRTSTTSTATGTPTAAPGGSPLPPIAIALIALGAAAAVLLCCLIGALLWRRRKSRRDREPLRGDSEFYAGPGPDEDIESIHAVPNLTGERHSLLGNDSFIVVPGSSRSPQMTQRSFNGVSYQRLGESRAPSHHSSRRTGSTEIGVAYTDMPPPRSRRRTVTVVSNAVSSSPSHPTSSSRPGIGSMRSRNESQRSSLFERPAEQDESPVLPRESTNGMIRRASDIGPRLLQAPAPAAQPLGFPFGPGATLGTELGMLGLGTRYPDPSQSLLATSSSGGSYPAPRLVVPTPSSLGSRSRQGPELSRPTSQFVTGSQSGSRNSRVSRGHSPAPSIPPSPPPRDTMTWPDSPESEHDESAQLLTAERGNVRSGIGLLGRFSWFTRGNGSPARTSRNSYPGWMSPPTEEGFLAEADAEAGPSTYDPPTLESKPPTSHPGMVRLVPREQRDPTPPRPISSVSGGTVYHDAPSQPATPRTPVSTWLGFLGRASPASGPAPPVPQRPTPLSQTPTSTPAPVPSTTVTPPPPVRTRGSSDSEIDPASRLPREQQAPPQSRPHSDILDAPAPESLLDVASPVLVPPSPAPVFPPGLTRLPRTWNFGLLNELGDEPPAAEERWAHIRSTPSLSWDLRRFSLGRSVQVNSPHTVTDSQVASVHGGGTASPTTSDPRPGPISHSSSRSLGSQAQRAGGSSENSRRTDSDTRRAPAADPDQPGGTTRHSVSLSGTGTSADTTTVSSNHPSTLMMTESGRFGFDFGGYGYVDSEYDDYETRATTISSNISGDSSGREAVDLHGEDMEGGQEVYVREGGRFMPPMSAVGISNWGQHADADPGRA